MKEHRAFLSTSLALDGWILPQRIPAVLSDFYHFLPLTITAFPLQALPQEAAVWLWAQPCAPLSWEVLLGRLPCPHSASWWCSGLSWKSSACYHFAGDVEQLKTNKQTTDDLVSFCASSLVALAEGGIENGRGGCWGPSYGRATGSGVLALCWWLGGHWGALGQKVFCTAQLPLHWMVFHSKKCSQNLLGFGARVHWSTDLKSCVYLWAQTLMGYRMAVLCYLLWYHQLKQS